MHYDPVLCMNVPDKVTAKDAAVNEYEIHYTIPGKNQEMVGSGKGSSEAEAKADFLNYHKSENPKITSVKLYKKIKDSKTIDQAIRSCDAVNGIDFNKCKDKAMKVIKGWKNSSLRGNMYMSPLRCQQEAMKEFLDCANYMSDKSNEQKKEIDRQYDSFKKEVVSEIKKSLLDINKRTPIGKEGMMYLS